MKEVNNQMSEGRIERKYKRVINGAIIGDVVGSRFEFDNIKTKDFDFFTEQCDYTDDSVMTIAIAKSLMDYGKVEDYEDYKKVLVDTMHEVGRRYPYCGYGGRFSWWMLGDNCEPYGSYGNGSAMRVSPVGWVASSLEEAEALAKATAEVSHNHPEGIKGAQVVAGAIFLARKGASKESLREYMEKFYNLDFTLDEIRPTYDFIEICQESVPQALVAFLEAEDFEDTIRNAISIGGDSDTIAAIAGSIAEAYYEVDEEMADEALAYLDEYLLSIVIDFNNQFADF